MKKILFLFLLFTTFHAHAIKLNCEIYLNSEIIFQNTIKTLAGEKILIGKTSVASTYVTEKANHVYQLEAFLPDYEVRVYAQSNLTQTTDQLELTLWGRDSLIDVKCLQPN